MVFQCGVFHTRSPLCFLLIQLSIQCIGKLFSPFQIIWYFLCLSAKCQHWKILLLLYFQSGNSVFDQFKAKPRWEKVISHVAQKSIHWFWQEIYKLIVWVYARINQSQTKGERALIHYSNQLQAKIEFYVNILIFSNSRSLVDLLGKLYFSSKNELDKKIQNWKWFIN